MFGDVSEQTGEATTGVEDFDWSEDVSTFGDRLSRARDYAGMSQGQLARRIGVKVATIVNWETDRSEPRANRLQMLSGLLNVSIIWLMTGEGEGGPAEQEPPATGDRTDIREILNELRDLRLAQDRLADRTGLVEKRLRALLSDA